MKSVSFKNDILPLKDVLYRLALGITKSREDAEDTVQETLIRIWQQRDQWETIESMRAYSLTLCRNQALDLVKKASRREESLDDRPAAETGGANPYEGIISQDRMNTVRQILDTLPEKQRSCMQLRDFEGYSYREIAQMLGITEEQVKVSIFRARQTLKKRFEQTENYGL